MPVVACLAAPAAASFGYNAAAVRQGLEEAGYVEGRNVRLEFHWAEGQYQRLPAMAAELARRNVAVIVTMGGTPSILAAKAATTRIPIVFHLGADPIQLGIVGSLNRPGGNITGVTLMGTALDAKRLELLHKTVPAAGSVGLMVNPSNLQTARQLQDVRAAAGNSRLELLILEVGTERELQLAFTTLAEKRVAALLIGADVFLASQSARLAALAAQHRVATMAQAREFTAAGGLMSYGTNSTDAYRMAGVYAGRVLKGEKPADLPVLQPTKFEFVVNLKAAKALNLEFHPQLLATADEVIE